MPQSLIATNHCKYRVRVISGASVTMVFPATQNSTNINKCLKNSQLALILKKFKEIILTNNIFTCFACLAYTLNLFVLRCRILFRNYMYVTVNKDIQVNLDMTDSMEPGKFVRHMQNPSYTYDEYLIYIGMGPSILSVICKNPSYSGPSYPSSPVHTLEYGNIESLCPKI